MSKPRRQRQRRAGMSSGSNVWTSSAGLGLVLGAAATVLLGGGSSALAGEPPIVYQPPRPRPAATVPPAAPTPASEAAAPAPERAAEPCPMLAERDWQGRPECARPGAPPNAEGLPETTGSAADESADGAPADGTAEADEFDHMPCVLVPRPGCGTQAHIELGMGWGESHSYVGTQWSYRGFAEAGMLVGLDRDWQLGPALAAAFDLGRVNSGWGFVPKLKSRYWIGGWYMALDGSLGWSLERFVFDHGIEAGTRMGVEAEVAITALGLIGPYVSLSALGDPDGRGGSETRWLVGFRAGLLSWVAVFGALSGAGYW